MVLSPLASLGQHRAESGNPVPVSSMHRGCGVAVMMALALGGCATESVSRVEQPYVPIEQRVVRIENCEDRTGFTGQRDIKGEASRILAEKIRGSSLFEVATEAPLVLTCDIERFAEGSALKRWVLPGWGSTQAGVAVMLWERPGDKLLGTFRSQSHVDAGGLYTIGADQYIFSVAFDDIVKQIREWMAQGPAAERK
jgi:hypothetical protein